MDTRKIWIGVAVLAGLVVLFFVGREVISWQKGKREETNNREQAIRNLSLAKQNLHQICRYADSVGIDTSRYAITPSVTREEVADKIAQLMMEVRYGKKPSRVVFSGLPEAIDSSWVGKADTVFFRSLLGNTSFAPYNQLVGHYNRLRNLAKTNPAVADSLRLIRQTLNFYRYINRFEPERFVVVNIPAGELNVFDQSGKRFVPMKVVAGKKDKRTPCMTTYIKDIVAYPYWNVPKSIVTKEMLPKIQKDVAFLYNQNLEVLDSRNRVVDPEEVDWESLSETNFPYRIRQASGCDNALGLIKFDLENPLAIYLHDTNGRDIFTVTNDRWRSHGCVRVQKPVELANFVLGKETFDAGFMNRCLIDQKPQTLSIPKRFPVFITYNIADVDAAGKLRFYNDVYELGK
ncbi:L,D-transpeptidase family protein [Spirosoma oryzicola]|uniref:L,D-transpeptidase family protein n=1 Tax=Spirosoma oryzicola TaxID=2898794 RepID=UPI001E2D4A00|nr:L,D-transpeptidase family protein [Spirosoma oryzicola]UHG89474.1 L,D-transpeptidase family protein [Spirosoma oryzicola]